MRGREVPDPGAGAQPAGVPDDARHARETHPRLRPLGHHQPVRRLRHRRRHRHHRPAPAPPRDRVPQVPGQDRHRGPRPPRRAPGLRQLRHPQSAHRAKLAGQAPALPHALHPNLFQLDQPGRTLVRRTDPTTHRTRRPPQCAGPRTRHPRLGQRLERQPQTIRVDQDRRTDPPVHPTINETN